MTKYLIDGDSIEFHPDTSWSFDGFDGIVVVKAATGNLRVEGKPIVLAEDLTACGSKILQKAYKAKGFDKTPGAILSAEVSVDDQTLSELLTCDGKKVATEATAGTFSITCSPSKDGSAQPVPDPEALSHDGKWSVVKTTQDVFDMK